MTNLFGEFADHLRDHAKDWMMFAAIVVFIYAGVFRTDAHLREAGDVLVRLATVVGLVHGGKKIAETVMNRKNGHTGGPPTDSDTPPSPLGGGGA